jgi:hypothetical protein
MSDPSDDMDKPITKREALEIFLTKREFHDVMKNVFEYLDKRFEAYDERLNALMKWFGSEFRQQLNDDIATHVGTMALQLRRDVGLLDDRYKDLPERVTKLEEKVFAPKRQRRRS